jgi:hypothetical protein
MGPVPGGGQFIVDFTKPNGAAWFSTNCPTEEIAANRWVQVETPRNTSTEHDKKFTNGIGTFGFKIRFKNELQGTNKVLYTGKYKVGKVSTYNGTPVTKNAYEYYVDHDWALPFGYLWVNEDELSCALTFKKETNDLAGYIFYKGKQIGSTKDMGSTGLSEVELDTARGQSWKRVIISWPNIELKAPTDEEPREKMHYLDKNPGEYEIKVLRSGKLCREAKFTVGEDGKIVGNKFNAPDKLNTSRIVIQVKVIGTTDGAWNKLAWKTEAFYGNPVPRFTAP